MPQKQIGNAVFDIDADGFMTNVSQWTRDVAVALAKEEGIAELTAAHWKVLGADPLKSFDALGKPEMVFIGGRRR